MGKSELAPKIDFGSFAANLAAAGGIINPTLDELKEIGETLKTFNIDSGPWIGALRATKTPDDYIVKKVVAALRYFYAGIRKYLPHLRFTMCWFIDGPWGKTGKRGAPPSTDISTTRD